MNQIPSISVVREPEPGLSTQVKVLIGLGVVLVLVVGRAFVMGSDPEPPRRSPPPRRVTAPAATEAPAPPANTPAPAATAPATKKDKDDLPPEPRGLGISDSARLRDAALEDITRYEKAGRYQDALEALDEAVQNGANKTKLEGTRVRLKERAERARTVDDAFAETDRLLGNGEFDAALRALHRIDGEAKDLDRSADVQSKAAQIDAARNRSTNLLKGAASVSQAQAFLDAGDLASARTEIEKARALVAGSPELGRAEMRLHDMERLPAGFTYVLVTPDKGLYVRKKPVTNAEFKKWVDDTGRAGAAPWKNGYPASDADATVRGVFLDAAKNFAIARSERLPTDEEWPAIKKALHVEEARPHAGVFNEGFYTVKNP